MIIRRVQATAPIDRPFPDENTVAEMYCNEAYTIDNEAVEDWTSSLQMLLTFAAIFSAVLITLIVDSKALLEQDSTDILVDAVVFLMNNLANGTHQPYSPPKFHPSTRSILVNCCFFASLCLSIATALAAVLAMQWVTDYGAVTRRAGSTPEERVKRRHFRYQGRQDWNMDTIIGALPVALHLSVLLFFVGLIVWMWDVHHSVFGVTFVCGGLAALFYVITTTLAVFCPSCPYRTPLAGWIYAVLHCLTMILSRFTWLKPHESQSDKEMEAGATANSRHASGFRRLFTNLHTLLSQHSLSLRDDVYIRSPDKSLMRNSLIWLSNHISISPDVYTRLFVLINGFSPLVDTAEDSSAWSNVPWPKILHALGTIYKAFVEHSDLSEELFVEFAGQTHCLCQPGMKMIIEPRLGSKDMDVDNPQFPARLLCAWINSLSYHTSDTLRKQRFYDEANVRSQINEISSRTEDLLKTWYQLLDDEVHTCDRILPRLLHNLRSGDHFVRYVISTGHLPWSQGETIRGNSALWHISSTPLARRLQVINWVESLAEHPQQGQILRSMNNTPSLPSAILLLHSQWTDEEKDELRHMGFLNWEKWETPETRLASVLVALDRVLAKNEEQGGTSLKRSTLGMIVEILCDDLARLDTSFDSKSFNKEDKRRKWILDSFQSIQSAVLRAIAVATLGVKWDENSMQGLIMELGTLNDGALWSLSRVCLKSPPFINGDYTALWELRLRLWIHFHSNVALHYFSTTLDDLNSLKLIEQEMQSTRLRIKPAGDFLLPHIHLNHSYRWAAIYSPSFTLIPDILVGNTISVSNHTASTKCIEYLTSICRNLSEDPVRLIRLLIELVRADINHEPRYRRPFNLLGLLKHAKTYLASKELRPFGPSCRRLIEYIRESHKQFEDAWDEVISRDYSCQDPRPHYQKVDRGELKTVCNELIDILEPRGYWDGEEVDVSWPRQLVRPTGTEKNPFKDEVENHLRANNSIIHNQWQIDQIDSESEEDVRWPIIDEVTTDGQVKIGVNNE
ncbi:hypothetical protein FRC14_004835 [Serendipita sp. 396]|nr:hypothetical protein FRC14_004835 [Serendipita sp. 396]KAG8776999.1 hypothetical protein FRC15_011581 [Serendipita sp. 397]KAG8797480.1 hypothetical protein FRC16_008815 [Serendipita sp. 398]KAG8834282.1 hypothetical protein FRC18_002260 [Serendipita sp. 400]KAG8849948.1 hypothetical protein FRB91_009469 [Serendipita sp. 411]KAG8866161.1 hypothetical protein FRC20_009009 [Serendipita sp. 405]